MNSVMHWVVLIISIIIIHEIAIFDAILAITNNPTISQVINFVCSKIPPLLIIFAGVWGVINGHWFGNYQEKWKTDLAWILLNIGWLVGAKFWPMNTGR